MMPEIFKGQREKYKIGLVAGLFVITCLSVYYFHAVLKTCIIVSHFFYIPIILVCIWWKRKGLIVAIFSSAFLIFSHIIIRPDVTTINDYTRAIMIIAVAIVVVLLSEHSAKAEEKLKNSEKRLQILFKFAPDAYFLYDLEGIVIDVNRAAKEIIGYEKHELIGKKFSEITALPQAQIQKVKQDLVDRTLGKPVGPTELVLNRKDGKQVIVEIRTYPVKIEGQTLLLGIARDITERKKAEKEKNKILHNLKERMKELNCLYEILNIVEIPNISLNEIFEKILKVIQTGWQYPEITCVRIMINGKEYKTPNYKDTEWKQSAWIKAYGDVIGDIDIFYLEGKPKIYEEPFLKEERKLINSIAKHLGKIIERKQAEKALIESETKYRTLVDHLPAIIYIAALDETSTTLFVSYQVEALLGYTQKEYIDDPDIWVKHLHADDRERVLREVAQCHATGEPLQIEYRMLHRDGRVMWFRDEAIIVRDADGESNQLQGFMLDITEHKKAEEKLRDSEEFNSSLLNNSPNPIIVINPDTSVRYVNPALEKITGFSSEELIGHKSPYPWWTEETLKKTSKDFKKATLDGALKLEELFQTKKGERFWVEITSIPVKNDVVFNYYLANWVDITEKKRLQEFASRAQRLETAGRVAGQVAHDFNNLLAPLMAYPEIIKEELSEDHPVLQYIDEIERSAEQITEINQQLLTLGRRGHYSLESLSLNDIVTNVIKQIHIVPETLVIETDLSDKLMNIKGGNSQIFRAILNLVHNARDAMMDVGQLTIKTENYYVDKLSGRFGRVPRGEYVKLTVSDTGSGIPADIMPKILDPFFTTKTTTKKRGSGLGLSIVHAVVEDHNGYIDVESTVGEGTNFYLYFPITRESSEETIPEQIVGGTENILIVDDDKVQKDVVSRLLEKLGYKASTVESGEKAIDFIKEKPQDMLVLDMIMPDGIDGAETYEEALKVNPSQKAIIISGYKETQRVEEALKLGAGAFIRKPLTLKTIAQALRKELDKKQAITSAMMERADY